MKHVILCTALLFTGCMSDKEYQLRKHQLANQAAHPQTYDLFTVDGPVKFELAEGGKARVTVPGQPFREIAIPDGVRSQTELVRHLAGIGAMTVFGLKALENVHSTSTVTTTTTTGGTP